jgi:hypothetical protein
MNKDMHSRHKQSAALSKSGHYHSQDPPTEDEREVSTTTPLCMLGVVIHRQFFVSPNITSIMCLECTILDNMGNAHSTFQNYLFTLECMAGYLTHLQSNVVVRELEDSCIEGYEPFGLSLSQTQPNVQYLSQCEQVGDKIVSKLDQMGYGLSEPLQIFVGLVVSLNLPDQLSTHSIPQSINLSSLHSIHQSIQ